MALTSIVAAACRPAAPCSIASRAGPSGPREPTIAGDGPCTDVHAEWRWWNEELDRAVEPIAWRLPPTARMIRVATLHVLSQMRTAIRVDVDGRNGVLHVARWSDPLEHGGPADHRVESGLSAFEVARVVDCMELAKHWQPASNGGPTIDGEHWRMEVLDRGEYSAVVWNRDAELGRDADEILRCRALMMGLH